MSGPNGSRTCALDGCNVEFVPRRRNQIYHTAQCGVKASNRKRIPQSDALSRLEKLLAENNIDPTEIGSIKAVKINEWEGFIKNADDEIEKTTLRGASLVLHPSWATGPEWPVVQPAKPVNVRIDPVRPKGNGGWKTAVVLPDPQVGFRQLRDGTMDPFHDEKAMAAALRVVSTVAPHRIVNLGDLLDFASFGRYVQEPSFAQTSQAAIDRAHQFLAEQRTICPKAVIDLEEGNHDKRLPLAIINNAVAAFGLQQANKPASWPVLSVPHLLRLDELKVRYHAGYPANETWINDRLVCRHAPSRMSSVSSSAAKSAEDERVSVIFGHTHRIEVAHRTRPKRGGYTQILQASPGCLCRIDGAVPGTNSGTDPFGAPVLSWRENWQQGCAVVTYKDGDSPFQVELVPIIDGKALFRGSVL